MSHTQLPLFYVFNFYLFGLILLNLASVVILFNIVDRGRLISPAYSRLNRRDLEKLRAVSAPHRAPLVPESGD